MQQSKLLKLRLVQFADIAAVPLFGWIAESDRGHGSSDWTLWHWVITAFALYAAIGGFFVRQRLMRRSEEALAKDASNSKALKEWDAAQYLGVSSAEAIVICGVAVRMGFGGTLWQASLFYAAGLLLLILWTPRLPAAAS